MDVFEAIWTTRSMRRLDPTRPVREADLWRILEAANRGPTAGNRQEARWLVVTERSKIERVGTLYRSCWNSVRVTYAESPDPFDQKLCRSADYLAEHMAEAPVLIVACSPRHRKGGGGPGWPEPWDNPLLTAPLSVLPAVQNLCIAARALGIGTTITGVHRLREQEVKQCLGIPEDVLTWVLVALGYPLGRWGVGRRAPVEDVVYWNEWGQRTEARAIDVAVSMTGEPPQIQGDTSESRGPSA